MTLSNYKMDRWYLENQRFVDNEINNIIYDMKANINIPSSLPYCFFFDEEQMTAELKKYLYKIYASNLR
jgi:hypothetical protein